MKATSLVAPVVRQLVQHGRMNAPLAAHIMTVVLQGLQVHGQHDANQGSLLLLGTQLYELLRPKYFEVFEVSNLWNIDTIKCSHLLQQAKLTVSNSYTKESYYV